MRNAHGYHVTYSSLNPYPAQAPPADPVRFDLQVQPSGDFQGTYVASDGFIGQFDLRRFDGVVAVRHISLASTFGVAGAPETAMQFFGVTYDQASAPGDAWLPLTGSAQQRAAAAALMGGVQPYVSASTFADRVLSPPIIIDAEAGLDAGSTLLRTAKATLTFRLSPDPFIDYATPTFEVRVDGL